MWPRCVPSGTHRSRERRDSVLSSERSEWQRTHQPSGWQASDAVSHVLRDAGEHHRRSQTRTETPCLPRLFGSGTPKRLAPRGETSSTERSGRRDKRGSIERFRVDPKPMGASSGAEPKGYVAATDSSVEKSPEVDGVEGAAWRHASGSTSNGERARQSVNAAELERARRGDGMARLPRRGTLRRVFATGEDSPDLRVHDLRVDGSAERPNQRVRNVVNPTAGCGVQQTREPSNGWILGSICCGGNR